MKKRIYASVVLVVLVGLLVGCGFLLESAYLAFQPESIAAQPTVIIGTSNGFVNVVSVSGDQITVEGEMTATGEDVAVLKSFLQQDVDVTVTDNDGTIVIQLKKPTVLPVGVSSVGANLTVKIPATVNDLTVQTSNGAVNVDGLIGKLAVTNSNGTVELRNVSGDMVVKTSNGSVNAIDVKGIGLYAHTTNGSITIDTDELIEEADLYTSNSDIFYRSELSSFATSTYDLVSSNGEISFVFPYSQGIDVEATTSNGTISSEFPIDPNPTNPTYVKGYINAGGADVTLSTSNGNISIRGF